MIKKGIDKAKELGFDSIIVIGHKEYYPKFGFQRASRWNIKCPFEVPDEAFMAINSYILLFKIDFLPVIPAVL